MASCHFLVTEAMAPDSCCWMNLQARSLSRVIPRPRQRPQIALARDWSSTSDRAGKLSTGGFARFACACVVIVAQVLLVGFYQALKDLVYLTLRARSGHQLFEDSHVS